MKVTLEIERLYNGFVVKINDIGYVCASPRDLVRRIIELTETGDITTKAEKMQDFWKDKVGEIQKMILEDVNKNGFSTIERIAFALYKEHPDHDLNKIKSNVRISFMSLRRREFLVRREASKKYYKAERGKL